MIDDADGDSLVPPARAVRGRAGRGLRGARGRDVSM